MKENPANTIKDTMWKFLMDKGQKSNIPEQCCGTCKCHVPGEVPGEGDWICNNGESEYYGLKTGYDDECMNWCERE